MLQKAKINEIMVLRLRIVHRLVEMFPNATPFRISKMMIFLVAIVVVAVFFFAERACLRHLPQSREKGCL